LNRTNPRDHRHNNLKIQTNCKVKKGDNMAGKYWRLMGEYNAETKTYSALAGTVASPYTPDKTGKLAGLRVIPSADAVTTLSEAVQFKLTCTTFNPNAIEVGGQGNGLCTVAARHPMPIDWAVDQNVVAGVPITIEARNLTADTPVGVLFHLYGLFE
jgi:hypothetical protein